MTTTTEQDTPEVMMRTIVSSICKFTNAPMVRWDQNRARIQVMVDGRDQGRLVGKDGFVHWAIDSLCWYAGRRLAVNPIAFDLLEPVEHVRERVHAAFKPNPRWSRGRVTEIVEMILRCCLPAGLARMTDIAEESPTRATVKINIHPRLRDAYADPDLVEAITRVIHSIGMANGANLKTEVSWS